jgi:hypothetical protein
VLLLDQGSFAKLAAIATDFREAHIAQPPVPPR